MVRDTSLEAYTIDRRTARERVFLAVKPGDIYTRRELANKLGMLTSSMSGRINELIKEGKLEETAERVTCQVSGRLVHGIRRTPVEERRCA